MHKDEKLLKDIRVYSQEMLLFFEIIVNEYEKAGNNKIRGIEAQGDFIFVLSVLILFVAGIFIFYPASRKIEKNTMELKEAIQDKTKELQKSIDIISDYVIYSRTDLKGIITYVNKIFCDISGFTKEELIGHPHNVIRHPDTPKETFQEMWRTIKVQKRIWAGVIKNRARDGRAYYVQTSIMPILNKEGEVKEFIALRNDISSIYKEN